MKKRKVKTIFMCFFAYKLNLCLFFLVVVVVVVAKLRPVHDAVRLVMGVIFAPHLQGAVFPRA